MLQSSANRLYKGGSVLEMNLDLPLHSFFSKELASLCFLDVSWNITLTYNIILFTKALCHIDSLYILPESMKAKESHIFNIYPSEIW